MRNACKIKKVYLVISLWIVSSVNFDTHAFHLSFDSMAMNDWVDKQYKKMNLNQRVGQLFMVDAYSNRDQGHVIAIEELIEKHHIGGLIFMQGGPVRQAQLTNHFQNISKLPLLIGMDGETGLAMRLDSTLAYPKQITLGAIDDERYIYNMAAEYARQLQAIGVHINFAPVVDININPQNPVIGHRSLGENPERVTGHARAFVKGLQENGVLACAKHFPGHGDTDVDSHQQLPVINQSLDRLKNVELHPFSSLIKDDLAAVMTGHLHVMDLDSSKNKAASLSESVVTGLLKNEMGFDGLVITDALNMGGVTQHFDPGDLELQAFIAGNDILLFSQNIPEAINAIKKAISEERIDTQCLEEKVKKILRYKYRLGLNNYQPTNTDQIPLKLHNPKAYQVKQHLFEKAVTVVNNENNLLPVRDLDTLSFASLSIGKTNYSNFKNVLGKFAPFNHYFLDKGISDPNKYSDLLQQLKQHDYVIVGVHDLEDSSSKINLNDVLFLKSLNDYANVIPVVFGNPYLLLDFQDFDHLICAYEDDPMMHAIVPQVIFGAMPATGRLPVTASSQLPEGIGFKTPYLGRLGYGFPEDVGMDSRVLQNIDQIAQEAITHETTPGCQVLVARNGKVIFEKSYGFFTYDKVKPIDDQTIYDLASITKVAATLQAIMFLEDQGTLDLNQKASHYLPELANSNKRNLYLKDILTHQAGLRSFIPFWEKTMDDFGYLPTFYNIEPTNDFQFEIADGIYGINSLRDSIWQWTVDSELRPLPRYRKKYDYRYSDLGFYILHQIAERQLNQPMEVFLEQNFYRPLGLSSLGYLPSAKFSKQDIAPTEEDYYFRKNLVQGTVHDPVAAMFGGVAGHAGLFSNAHDLAVLMQMNLQGGYYGGRNYLKPSTVEQFTRKQFEDNRRGLGWDKPSYNERYNVTSRYSSPKTFGHTGFTGTAVWTDPEFDLIYVFLSNRIHPDASNTKLITENVRTRIHDVIYESIWSFEKYLN